MLSRFPAKLEQYLSSDQELGRRLQGFKTFSGKPDGHHRRARQQGEPAIARAVRCYPFGGTTELDGAEVIAIHLNDRETDNHITIALRDRSFKVTQTPARTPLLSLDLSTELFKKALLGRYRWLWLMGMDEVGLTYSRDLPHSDWITILEILVAMQEMAELDPEMWRQLTDL